MQIRVAVVGAGSWGTTIAHLISGNAPTILWARDDAVAAEISQHHTNSRYLAGFELNPQLAATTSMREAISGADVVVMGVPSHGFRAVLDQAREHVRPWIPVVSLAKGLEQGTRLRMTEVIREVLPGHPYGVLTGPNLAREIIVGDAAATVLAMSDKAVAAQLQQYFSTGTFRVYTNPDIVGCEIAGALKNVMAIASGMADGLGTGDNTRAAVITRGLSELTRLGIALGGEAQTFAGLAGMGDLIVTCISPQSRNRHVGEQLGRGRAVEDVIAEMPMIAEGVRTVRVALELAAQHHVEMPIAEQVYRVINEGVSAGEAYRGLLDRPPTLEMRDGLVS